MSLLTLEEKPFYRLDTLKIAAGPKKENLFYREEWQALIPKCNRQASIDKFVRLNNKLLLAQLTMSVHVAADDTDDEADDASLAQSGAEEKFARRSKAERSGRLLYTFSSAGGKLHGNKYVSHLEESIGKGKEFEPHSIPIFTVRNIATVVWHFIYRVGTCALTWYMFSSEIYAISTLLIIMIPGALLVTFQDESSVFFPKPEDYRTEEAIMAYIKTMNKEAIHDSDELAPFLEVKATHEEGGDEHTSSTTVVDYYDRKSLRDAITNFRLKPIISTSNEDGVTTMLKTLARQQIGKKRYTVLAIESTFEVEIDSEVEDMIKNELEQMATGTVESCGENLMMYVNEEYIKNRVVFVDLREKGKGKEGEEENEGTELKKGCRFYVIWVVWIAKLTAYVLAYVLLGARMINRVRLNSSTLRYELKFKVKICPSSGTHWIRRRVGEPQGETV